MSIVLSLLDRLYLSVNEDFKPAELVVTLWIEKRQEEKND